MKINGEVIRQVDTGLGTFNVYRVKVKGGPHDGEETLAMNTTVVYFGRHAYKLNAEGDFVYDDGKLLDNHAGSGKL